MFSTAVFSSPTSLNTRVLQSTTDPVMEDGKVYLYPNGAEILKQSRSAFCHVLQEKFGCTVQIHNVEDEAAPSFTHSKVTIVPELKYSKWLSKNLMISVWKDDLTTHKVDAVVNAANERLSHGAGLAQALSQAGGPMIQKWSNEIIKKKGIVHTGEVVVTQSGNLPCKMILHAVGPSVSHTASQKEIDKASQLLQQTIQNILLTTKQENLQSVSIPAISSGLYNFPCHKCAEVIVKTVKLFSDNYKRQARSLEVRLVNNDDATVKEMYKACATILGPSEANPKQYPKNESNQSVLSSLDLGNVTLHLKKGAIEEETADVLVNTIGGDLNLSTGLVSKAMLQKAGRGIQNEIKKHPRRAFYGDVIPTNGYKLNCASVYHTICAHKSTANAHQILMSVINQCLVLTVQMGYSSIYFPAIGTGNLGFEKDEVSQIMTQAVLHFSQNNNRKINVCFVIFPKDIDTLKAFEKEMASIQSSTHRLIMNTSNISDSTSGKRPGFHGSQLADGGTPPHVELIASSQEALREAKLWCVHLLQWKSDQVTINNNHIVYFGQKDHESLIKLQDRFNVTITVFFKEGQGGIVINGRTPEGVSCAVLKVEFMLCQVQEAFARREEKDMQATLEHICMVDSSGQQSNWPYQKKQIDVRGYDQAITRNFEKCNLRIVKVEKIENHALKQLFGLNSECIQGQPRLLYQCVKAQFCNLICRVGFQREYAPPKEQNYGAGIYFTDDVDTAKSLWTDSYEEYVYFIAAQVLTGNQTKGLSNLIVPPPVGKDSLVHYDSVTGHRGIHVIFNGQQAYPEFLITCSRQSISL